MSRVGDRLAEHVAELARAHDVKVIHRGSGIAYRRDRRITIQPVRGRSSYFVALHELGHVLGPNPRRRLDQEVAAWRWALEHALEPPTPAVTGMILRCLRNYRARAERGTYGTVLPDGYDDFIVAIESGHRPGHFRGAGSVNVSNEAG